MKEGRENGSSLVMNKRGKENQAREEGELVRGQWGRGIGKVRQELTDMRGNRTGIE